MSLLFKACVAKTGMRRSDFYHSADRIPDLVCQTAGVKITCEIDRAVLRQRVSVIQVLVHKGKMRQCSAPKMVLSHRGDRGPAAKPQLADANVHMDISRGLRAPKSEKKDTTPRSDFRSMNRSQWRDRAGFTPASTSRMRAFYCLMRVGAKHLPQGTDKMQGARH